MRLTDVLVLAWRQLKERKLRTILTVLAVAVGVTTILALSAQVEGVKVSIIESLGRLGPETILVTQRGRMPITDADVARLLSLEGISKVIPILTTSGRISTINENVNLVGIGSTDIGSFLGDIRLLQGNLYPDVPAPQAIVGNSIAFDQAGSSRYSAGQPILIQLGQRQIMLTVVGVLDSYGASLMIQPDRAIFVPIEYTKNLIRSGGYSLLVVKAVNAESVDQIIELLGFVFGDRVSINTIKQITQTVVSVVGQINMLLIAIAGTSFIAAGLGTLNIMMISVLERVREIGILKALGMKDRGVLILYITQGLLVGVFGSLAGLGLGYGLAYALPAVVENFSMGQGQGQGLGMGQGAGFMSSYTPAVTFLYIGLASLASVVITLLSSAYPAWRASKLSPVEALRYE